MFISSILYEAMIDVLFFHAKSYFMVGVWFKESADVVPKLQKGSIFALDWHFAPLSREHEK